jgi:hypothetical protein
MPNLNEKTLPSAAPKIPQNNDLQAHFGYGHKDIDDDFAALKSVLGISAFSDKFKQMENPFSALKALFNH